MQARKYTIRHVEVVKLTGVWVRRGRQVVLEDVDFCVHEGDYVGIIGPNGAGKTTLLKVILGLIRPFKGEVRVFGRRPEEARALVGYVPQERDFDRDFPIRVIDVVLMGRLGKAPLLKPYGKEDREKAFEVLRLVEMDRLWNRPIGSLSGGELQRVLIARALASEPRLLLLDEPTSNVDLPVETEFFELLEEIRKGMTVILVTHDIGVISTYVEKIACLNRRLYYHGGKEIRPEDIEAVYGCPVDLIAHGVPHRVLKEHP